MKDRTERTRSLALTMSFPYDHGWQLSRLRVPAVVARTWALGMRDKLPSPPNTGIGAHKTNGDLIFSASRTRFTLFHAYRTKASDGQASPTAGHSPE